ncbi:hypothetical protein [Rhizohabitans arisaemae]|uniref:hypothetical protein n=1 Tax=Rhizohabitans arisaemae TaxID=2720610 RepID=UPI0024B0DEB3|nr:hypothetical protein [Rhizohabitans arisaemae]
MATPVKTPNERRPVEHEGRRSLILAVVGLALTFLLFVIGIGLNVIALVASIRASRRAKQEGKKLGTARAATAISIVGLVIGSGIVATYLYFRPELETYADCKLGAATIAAEQDCVGTLERGMERKLPFLKPGELRFPIAP